MSFSIQEGTVVGLGKNLFWAVEILDQMGSRNGKEFFSFFLQMISQTDECIFHVSGKVIFPQSNGVVGFVIARRSVFHFSMVTGKFYEAALSIMSI